MKTHRMARIPPAGPNPSGRRLSMCGRYFHPSRGMLTTNPDEATCLICIQSTHGPRSWRLANE